MLAAAQGILLHMPTKVTHTQELSLSRTSRCESESCRLRAPSRPAALLKRPAQVGASSCLCSSCQSVRPCCCPDPCSGSEEPGGAPIPAAAGCIKSLLLFCRWLLSAAPACVPAAASRALSVASWRMRIPGVVISKCWYMSPVQALSREDRRPKSLDTNSLTAPSRVVETQLL